MAKINDMNLKRNLLFAFTIFFGTTFINAQVQQAQVTITVKGNKIQTVTVDDDVYTISNRGAYDNQSIVLDELSYGRHTLRVRRITTGTKVTTTTSYFTFRENYNMSIVINSNGTINRTEKAIPPPPADPNMPVSVSAYTTLYNQTKAKTSSTSRAAFLETKFNGSVGKFSSQQASELIKLVNSESFRLKLAKQVYTRITDPESFVLVANLLNSTAGKEELNTYVESVSGNPVYEDDDTNIKPITNAKFTAIYNDVKAEPSSADKKYYLQNFFGKTTNYYSSSQAKQLIELISNDEDRLVAAKASYRGITDKNNFSLVFQLFSSATLRNELLAYVDTYNRNNPVDAMDATAFERMYQTISARTTQTSRYNGIYDVLTAANNYYTVAQAKRLIELVSSESSRLELAKKVYPLLITRSEYAGLNDLFYNQSYRNEYNNYVVNYNNLYGTGSGIVMNDVEYNKLYRSVSDALSATSRFNLLDAAFKKTTNVFNVYQVRQLLQLINTDDRKLTLARTSWDNVIDPANYNQIAELFTTASYRDDFIRFVQNLPVTGANKTPMSDAEFRRIGSQIQYTFGIGAKMDALTNYFNNDSLYFTSAQVKQLIPMVSAEYNRVTLAKLSYNNVTDPANFPIIYDLFTSQASKDEVDEYVRNYGK